MRMRNSARIQQPQPPAGDEVAEMRSLKNQKSPRADRIAKAMIALERTNSPRVRNAAALALADLRARSAIEKLIALLRQPATKGSRGSLLYALEQLGANVPLPVLANIILEDAYEAREEALNFIVRRQIECSAQQFANATAALEAATASADGERLQAIKRALEILGAENTIRL